MSGLMQPEFNDPELCGRIGALDDAGLDGFDLGVVGFDADTMVRRYNIVESSWAGVASSRVRPAKVKLRLLAPPDSGLRYVLVSSRS